MPTGKIECIHNSQCAHCLLSLVPLIRRPFLVVATLHFVACVLLCAKQIMNNNNNNNKRNENQIMEFTFFLKNKNKIKMNRRRRSWEQFERCECITSVCLVKNQTINSIPFYPIQFEIDGGKKKSQTEQNEIDAVCALQLNYCFIKSKK